MRRLLLPLVPLYRVGLAMSERRAKNPRQLGWPVVSIGNLSTGGSGKTPLTIALAQALARRNVKVDVLSRGYGRRSSLPLLVAPDGSAEDFGDEPLLIAREAGVPVYVAAERYDAGMLAESASGGAVGVHLLDDGFQHRQLARAVDIVLVSGDDLRDHLLPAGNLREPWSALQRASVVAVSADQPEVESALKLRGWTGPVWRLRRVMDVPRIDGPVVAFCGIARPEQFFAGLESAGLHLASRVAFRDHHRYVQHDLDCLKDAAHSVKAKAAITTEKDMVRLGGLAEGLRASLNFHTAQLRVEIENEAVAADWLVPRIEDRGSK
jgi:tetraacyldisaccharide 4'-kinase